MRGGRDADHDLLAGIQELAESVPEVVPPEVPPPGTGGGRILLATAAFLGVAAVVVVALVRNPSGGPIASATNSTAGTISNTPTEATTPTPSQTASPSQPTAGTLDVAWTVLPDPLGPISAAGFSNNSWAALGEGTAWVSADGIHWDAGTFGGVTVPPEGTSASEFGIPQPVDIAILGDVWYALARWTGQDGDTNVPLIFGSTDGKRWEQKPSSGKWGYYPTAFASNNSSLIATQYEFGVGLGSLFTSDDAITWREHLASGGPASMLDVVVTSNRIAAVGYRYSDAGGEVPVVWWSDNGTTWAESQLAGALPRTTAWAISHAGANNFVVLATTTVDTSTDTLRAWFSKDAKVWSSADFPKTTVPNVFHRDVRLLPINAGVLAFATTEQGLAAWGSLDGSRWSVISMPDAVKAASVTALATDGESFLVFVSGSDGDVLLLRGEATVR